MASRSGSFGELLAREVVLGRSSRLAPRAPCRPRASGTGREPRCRRGRLSCPRCGSPGTGSPTARRAPPARVLRRGARPAWGRAVRERPGGLASTAGSHENQERERTELHGALVYRNGLPLAARERSGTVRAVASRRYPASARASRAASGSLISSYSLAARSASSRARAASPCDLSSARASAK